MKNLKLSLLLSGLCVASATALVAQIAEDTMEAGDMGAEGAAQTVTEQQKAQSWRSLLEDDEFWDKKETNGDLDELWSEDDSEDMTADAGTHDADVSDADVSEEASYVEGEYPSADQGPMYEGTGVAPEVAATDNAVNATDSYFVGTYGDETPMEAAEPGEFETEEVSLEEAEPAARPMGVVEEAATLPGRTVRAAEGVVADTAHAAENVVSDVTGGIL